jgi:hypothetical protein
MSDRPEDDKVRDALASLRGEAERAWQQRQCLATDRFWKVALGLAAYAPAEQCHLQTCAHCRRRHQEVQALARPAAVNAETPPRSQTAKQPLKVEADRPKKGIVPPCAPS